MTKQQAEALKVQIAFFAIQLGLGMVSGDMEAGKQASLELRGFIDSLVQDE